MAEDALGALFRAVRTKLTATSEVWGVKVYNDQAPGNVQVPYVITWWAGGGELNERVSQDAELLIGVKVVTDTQTKAFAASTRISELLNDADRASVNALNGGANWVIIHMTQERKVHLVETVNTAQLYHEGAMFRARMEVT